MFTNFFQLGARKRKFLSADDSPVADQEGRQPSIENIASPTPKRRRGGAIKAAPKKRTRSSFAEDIPTDPDISFVGETQLSFGSSILDSQFQDHDQDELVGPTPYAGARAPAPGIFNEEPKPEKGIPQYISVEPEPEVVLTPSKRRRGSRRTTTARSPAKSRTAKASKKFGVEVEIIKIEEEEKTGPSIAESMEVADSMNTEADIEVEVEAETRVSWSIAGRKAKEAISGAQVLDGLKKALQVLEKAGLTSGECREAENLVFDAFSKLRQRVHDDEPSN